MRTESIVMRLTLLPGILAAALALTLLLAACGSDDPGDGGDPGGGDVPTLTSREAGNPTPTSGATPTPRAAATPVDHTTAATDREALVALYEATDRFGWGDDDNWLSDAPLSEWSGVTINARGRVVSLFLYENRLSGEIPAELGNLSSLEYLYLFETQLSGEIPAEFGSLSSLKQLYLYRNQLSGEIPAWLGDLSSLERLYLSENQLSGEIPPELGNLANLQELYLSENRLSGCVPAGLRDVETNDLNLLGLPDC